ncbi:MAG: hypothetical protein CMJ48_01665 [Planctomycetaceae bacterium]|nr:hypothetical protein [Planctomycetaceae bacterium]
MTLFSRLMRNAWVFGVCGTLLLVGCFGGDDSDTSTDKGDATSSNGTASSGPIVALHEAETIETDDGFQTVKPYPLGDPRAEKGGAITTYIQDFPQNIRRMGKESNTWLNYTIMDLCYQGLLNLDPNTLEYIPMLASAWKISEDKQTFTFKINPKARWSDGKPVVAEDVVASWKIRMDETLLAPSNILTFGKLEEPVAIAKDVVEVRAKEKNWRNFLYFSTMSILPAHEISKITGGEYLKKYNYKLTAVTGPYILKEEDINKGKSVTLTRREDFWGLDQEWYTGLYNFNKIRFLVVKDHELAYEKVVKGELDFFLIRKAEWWAKTLPEVDPVKKNWLIRQKVFNSAPNGVAGYVMNMRNPPLDDIRVRKALQMLLDRETLIEKLAFNEYIPMNSSYPGSPYENPDNEKIGYDPGAAKGLLAEAGWKKTGPDGVLLRDGKRLSLRLLWYSPLSEKYLTSFKESCKSVGVEIKLERTQPETLWKTLMERKFEMATMAWGALVFPNPETSLASSLADKQNTNNLAGFKSERCDELFKQYDVAFSQEERVKIIQEVDKIVTAERTFVLHWYQPCQRILYWNKFGMPEYGLHKVLEWEDAFASWWVDEDKRRALATARKNKKALPAVPLELHYWDKPDAADLAQTAKD